MLVIFTIISIISFLLPHCETDYLGNLGNSSCPQPSWTEVQQQYKEMTVIYIQAAVILSFIITLIIDVIEFFISKKKNKIL